ncbi:MAG TPA: molybdate ABC transporter substrate-binding protein [Candidatus Ruania gallistercoris]|uniref:Molybdate ABC transporter substrate-binding protein n=1 Tax=Candidatus Ruania gallistercoris TaxID=2838746 RepID=A0A9D2J6D9_9MICO|nr:molybdate ABC transporter substrate-binding protein [Candidatus Ruania gallistercoris]
MSTRRTAGWLAGAAALALSAACGSGGAGGSGGSEATGEGGGDQTLTVFAAASLTEPMDELLEMFAAEHPDVTIEPAVYDGSSTLVTQLTEGAQADVLATANTTTMDDLVAAFGDQDYQPTVFATNTLVIAVPEGNPQGITSLADLTEATFVVCAPEVPCGAAATELFELAGFDGEPISLEQNVTATAERVASGEVDAGLVYATDVASRDAELDAVVPDAAAEVVNEYPIVALDGSELGQELADLVLSEEGTAVLTGYGFGVPE